MRPKKGQVARAIRKVANMAPSKGAKEVPEVKKRKVIVKKLLKTNIKKDIPTKSPKTKTSPMGIAKSLAISSKLGKTTSKQTTEPVSAKGKDVDVVDSSLDKKKDTKTECAKPLPPIRKKGKKVPDTKKSSQPNPSPSKVITLKNKRKVISKIVKKNVVVKQGTLKKLNSTAPKKESVKKETKSQAKANKPEVNKNSNIEKQNKEKPDSSPTVSTEVSNATSKSNISKKSEDNISRSRTNSPEKKSATVKNSDTTACSSIISEKTSPKSPPKSQKKSPPVQKNSKSVEKKSPNKVKENDESKCVITEEKSGSSSTTNTKIINNSSENKESKNISLPAFSNTHSVSPSGRKKLIGKVKPIARVKGTIIEKVISDPIIQHNINIVPASNLSLADDAKIKTTNVLPKSVDESKKSVDKDIAKILKVHDSSSTPLTNIASAATLINDPLQDQSVKNKTIVIGKAKKQITIKKVPKTKKPIIAKGSIVKKGPKSTLIKNIKLAKKLLKVSDVCVNEDSASESISSSDDITYSFPEPVCPIEEKPKDENDSLKSKSAIKPKVFKNIPKKILVKNKKCQGLNRGISQAHSKEKKSKCSVTDKDQISDKDTTNDIVISTHDVSENKTDESNKTSEQIIVEKTSQKNIEIVSDIICEDKLIASKPLSTNDALSDSKNDADDEEERYSFPEINNEVKTLSAVIKKKKLLPHSQKPVKKTVALPLADDSKRRMKLMSFWMGPKKHREASLNALAKVQCLYENESRSHVELGLMRTVDRTPPKWKDSKKPVIKTEKRELTSSSSSSSSSESEYEKKVKAESASEDDSDPPVKRNLRQQPTGAGKYWEMKLSSSEESEAEHKRPFSEKKKVIKTKVIVKTEKPSEPAKIEIKTEKPTPPKPKKPQLLKKKRSRNEVVMDLRDMVVRKRMASLNATAILAASYEKRSPKSSKDESTSDSTSSEKEDKKAKKPKGPALIEKSENSSPTKKDSATSPSEMKTKTLIVNQEADVTITGVYSTHTAHTGFCTVSEMQYRISATSHTQTSAAAAGEKELQSSGAGPSQSYTPLGALSSMHPPAGVGGLPQQHLHPGPSMESRPLVGSLGRRAGCSSAFSAPPHHHPDTDRTGYYQPAGPLISAGPLHGGFKADGSSAAGPSPAQQDPGYGRYQYPPPQQMMHYNPHYGPGSGYGPPAPPPRLPSMPPPATAPACYRPPPPAHRSHPTQHQPHPPYRPPPPPDNQVSPAGTDAYAPQFCTPCYQHPHVPPRPAISYLDSAYQGCPCPMQSCPKNVHTGPATGNPPASSGPSQSSSSGGKRGGQESTGGGGCCAVALNPSLGLVPPETLGPPSPARGSAGLDPPHPPRRARLGKAMARKSIAPEESPGHTMLLMCHPVPPTPLTINTDPPPPKVETVKNEEDSGDDVIIIDSPSSKIPPIDLSSSEENNGTDSRSEKDCEIVRPVEDTPIVVDLSIETKKELTDSGEKSSIEVPTKVETRIQEVITSATANSTPSSSDSPKKTGDVKPKTGSKRRCSNLDIDMEVEIDDTLGANGIGEHVKLQKRQKVINNTSQLPKRNGAMVSERRLMKKNNRLMNHSNVKKTICTTKVDKIKQTSKPITLIESVKTDTKKVGTKRKITTLLISEQPANKRKKVSSSLLKSADKKHVNKLHVEDIIDDNSQKKNVLSVPKAKSVTLLDDLLMKNNLDRVIDCVARNIPSDTSESLSVLNPAALFNVASTNNSTTPKATRKVSMLKPNKKSIEASEDVGGIKTRPVLNINNNVVKKVSESECDVVPISKVERKLSTDVKRGRTKSKSPASLNRLSDKNKAVEITAKIKNQSENETSIVKDIPLVTAKIESVTKGRKAHKSGLSGKGKRKSKSCDNSKLEEEDLALLRGPMAQPRWSNGWQWEGEPQLNKVYINNEDTWIKARCWSAMRHSQAGDTVKRGDSVLLRAGARRSEAPFVARVSQLWENPTDGEMMVSLLWYYRPEHTDRGRQPEDCLDEVFASRHRDANSVACIEDKCYVLTYNEYCRYRKQLRASEENIRCPPSIVPNMPPEEVTPSIATNDAKIPLNISQDLVLFCRRIYDFRLKKVLPTARP